MSERRFFVEPVGSTFELNEDEAHHARRVLRLEPGAQIVCFDGHGASWRARITRYEARRALLEILETLPVEPEPLPQIRLAIGLLKGEKMDLVVQKATELGIARLLPLATDFSESRPDAAKRATRWQRVAIEAAKQCERNRVPEIATPASLASALEKLGEPGVAFVERDGGSLRAFVDARTSNPVTTLTIFVGPEGGWSGPERMAFRAAGVASVSLGPRILRAETAAIAALAILGFALERVASEDDATSPPATRE